MSAPGPAVRRGEIVAEGLAKQYPPHTRRDWLLNRVVGRGLPTPKRELPWALKDVSLRVEPGGALGIVGHNGAGKSTLMRILAGISRPTSGTVRTGGVIAPQFGLGLSFNPYLTGRENVLLEGSLLGMSNREVRAKMDRILAFADIDTAIDRPLWTYSSGMTSRLGFAVASVVESDVMLLDEALTAGDAAFRGRCEQVLVDAAEAGRTRVIVSHGLSTLRRLCDTTLWLDHGRIRDLGPTEAILDAYEAFAKGTAPAPEEPPARPPHAAGDASAGLLVG
jgi:ABC-type polysaccharide/polyol phosphate transport system ATPase subunit